MEIEKSRIDVEKYVIRPGREWAVLYVDEDSGIFSVFSSWGNWAYSWRHHGCESLKHFLVQIARENDTYFENKLAGSKWFDSEKTENAIRAQILYQLRRGIIDRKLARICWKALDDFPGSKEEYYHWLYDQCIGLQEIIGENEPICIEGPPPSIREFKKHCFIPFAEYLRKELKL